MHLLNCCRIKKNYIFQAKINFKTNYKKRRTGYKFPTLISAKGENES
jgi:hypothetical protein